MPSSGASASPGAPDDDPTRERCIALYAWFFPISPSSPASAGRNRKGAVQEDGVERSLSLWALASGTRDGW
jgi:hypothetical protein